MRQPFPMLCLLSILVPFQTSVRAESIGAGKNRVIVKCRGPLPGKPPERRYDCNINIPDYEEYNRWLIFPHYIEDHLKLIQKVVIIQSDRNEDRIVSCQGLESDDGFIAIPIPARKRLFIPQWDLFANETISSMMIWVGSAPALSNGDTLEVVFKRITAKSLATGDWSKRGEWAAPNGTMITLDPSGIQKIQIDLTDPKVGSKRH